MSWFPAKQLNSGRAAADGPEPGPDLPEDSYTDSAVR